jgi:ABC-type branched-subunit amino acid transport system substrate-binding protein
VALAPALAVLVSLGAAACGSQLQPGQVAAAGNGVADPGNPGAVAAPVAGQPGATAAAVPGAGDPVAPDAPGDVDPGVPGAPSGSGPSGGPAQGPGDEPGQSDPEPGSCAGFQDGDGISADTIRIGNVSDISGPVPGLFQQTQDAVRAYVAYFNATSSICGRKLELVSYDSRTDASADQQAYTKACDEVFATVGSASAFDSGGAATADACGLPDIRTNSLTTDRNACGSCFGVNSTNSQQFENIVPDTIRDRFGGGQHAAMLYINAGAAAENGKTQAEIGRRRGLTYVYEVGIDIAEFNYAPYVQEMKDRGVETIQFIANDALFARLLHAMEQQNFHPKVMMLDPSAYTDGYIEQAGDAAEGTIVFTNFTPFEEASGNPELQLYEAWLNQVNPSAEPAFFGIFAWSAARLFTETAIRLGGDLDRASLVAAMKKVDNWTGNGLHAPQRVGPKQVAGCWRFLRLHDGRWEPYLGADYHCAGVTTLG